MLANLHSIVSRQWHILIAAALGLGGLALIGFVAYIGFINFTAGDDRDEFNVAQFDSGSGAAPIDTSTSHLPSLVGLYPARFVEPRHWDEPTYLRDERFGFTGIPDGFSVTEAGAEVATLSGDIRIRIPIINVDSVVEDLDLVTSDDGVTAYESPDNVVGFIPESGRPGSGRSGWFFGHLQSLGEGNVFRDIPRLVELARSEPINIFISNGEFEYLYRLNASLQLHEDELYEASYLPSLSEQQQAVFLCTCWPPRNYTQRVVLKAELLATRSIT